MSTTRPRARRLGRRLDGATSAVPGLLIRIVWVAAIWPDAVPKAGLPTGLLACGCQNLCHQVIFVDDATGTVMLPDPEMIQVGDAIWQWLQWRGLVQCH